MKNISSLFELFDDFKIAPFIAALTAATIALWLNSNYVSTEIYERDREIIMLKIDGLETETQALRWAVTNIQGDTAKILPLIERMEDLISKLITNDGQIVITKNMVELEREITSIKKDIEFLRSQMQLTR
tara:strand:- start:1017 stop:1406 length:390 start_codon:yes stop_codon:yes gene_type:complete